MSNTPVKTLVVNILEEQLNPDIPVTCAATLEALGSDSLDHVELAMAFEEEFECELPDEFIESMATTTVGQLVACAEAFIAKTWQPGQTLPAPATEDMFSSITEATEQGRAKAMAAHMEATTKDLAILHRVGPEFPTDGNSGIPISPQAIERYHRSQRVLDEIGEERARQIQEEGYTPEMDDREYVGEQYGDLAQAASVYASVSQTLLAHPDFKIPPCFRPKFWPWPQETFKPSTPYRMLVKAAALILAQLEQIDRKAEGPEGNTDYRCGFDTSPITAADIAGKPMAENESLAKTDPDYLKRLQALSVKDGAKLVAMPPRVIPPIRSQVELEADAEHDPNDTTGGA